MKLEVSRLEKTYVARGRTVQALAAASFRVQAGEFVSLLGPSGCGKSTALALIAGLDDPSGGEIRLDGELVQGPGPERGMVFQSYTLFPWLTVLQNAQFGSRLRCNATPPLPAAHDQRVRALLDLMGLRDFYAAYPRELSGGMQQRVAIVRALGNQPKLLLMDEPFGALDAQTRAEMQELMLLVQSRAQTTVLFVTHDVEEALYLSTRVLVFSARPGRVLRDFSVPFGPAHERAAELKLSSEFMQCKRELIQLLHPTQSKVDRHSLIERLV
jgi:NitT/TauT family transport system ATP-binding protein